MQKENRKGNEIKEKGKKSLKWTGINLGKKMPA